MHTTWLNIITILEPPNPWIVEFYAVEKRWSTDFEVLKTAKWAVVASFIFWIHSKGPREYVLFIYPLSAPDVSSVRPSAAPPVRLSSLRNFVDWRVEYKNVFSPR